MPDPTIRHVPTLNDNSSLPFLTYRYKIILQLNDFPLKQYRYKTAISTISYFRGAFSAGRLLWIEHKFTIDAAVRLGYVPLRTTSAHLNAPVAQLDRVLDSDSKGHRFESCRVHQLRLYLRTAFSLPNPTLILASRVISPFRSDSLPAMLMSSLPTSTRATTAAR